MLCVPGPAYEPASHVASPLPLTATDEHPEIAVIPSKKLTSPVGVPLPGELAATAAVYVASWPTTEGSALEVTVVVVLSWLMVWINGDPVVSLAR